VKYVNSTATELPVRVRLVGHRTVNGQHHVAIGDSLALFATTAELAQLIEGLSDVLGQVRVADLRVILGVAQ
jgi:hypothetical protein